MKKSGSNRGSFIILILLLVLYLISYIVYNITLGLDNLNYMYLLFILIISILSVLVISIDEKNFILFSGAFILVSLNVAQLVIENLHKFGWEDIYLLDSFYHIVSTIGLVLFVLGIYLEITRNHKRDNMYHLSNELNESFYLEFFNKTNELLIEFSSQFINKHGLTSERMVIDKETYITYIHPDDINISPFDIDAKYRIKFPGMNDYTYIHMKGDISVTDRIIYMGFDISFRENIVKKYIQLEQEHEKVLKLGSDYVCKLSKNGIYQYVSPSYAALFNLKPEELIGKSVFELGVSVKWFLDTVTKKMDTMDIEKGRGDKETWISWNNSVILNDKGDVENVICVGRDITDLVLLNKSLEDQSNHDHTTGLLNTKGLKLALENQKIKNAICFFIDIYRFANIRDYYGFRFGDLLLNHVANVLKAKFSDCLLARYAGDQFVIIGINKTREEEDGILAILENNLTPYFESNNTTIQLNLKLGYARYPDDTDDIYQLIPLASLAMQDIYESNLKLINKYEPHMYDQFTKNIEMSIRLREAIINRNIEVYFQKIYNTQNNNVNFIEALARWNDSKYGAIPPNYFFNIANQSGLILLLEEYLINKALDTFIELKKDEEFKNTKIAVNINPATLLRDDVVDFFLNICNKKEINPKDVCIEISEKTFVHNLDICTKHIKALKKCGFLIALDDFGKDYSSLSILSNIDFDIIKIDGTFVNNITDPKNKAIIEMIMTISKISQKEIIAECVENHLESRILLDMNCAIQQGYYFHVPEKLGDKTKD